MPNEVLDGFAQNPLVNALMPTAMGWYPNARYHYCERAHGAPEHILALCAEGSGWFQVGGVRDTLTQHEAMLLPQNTRHVYGASEASPWSLHWVHFVGGSSEYFFRQLPPGKFKLAVDPNASEQLSQLFVESYAAFASSFAVDRMIYASQTLHHLLALLFFNNHAFTPALLNSQQNIDETLLFLQRNIHRSLTLNEMAEHAKMSKSHFSRLFKKQTGYSPIDYFIRLKMQHACMLLSTRISIREIALQLGYEDPYYFSHSFKLVIGCAPAIYRRQKHGGAADDDFA